MGNIMLMEKVERQRELQKASEKWKAAQLAATPWNEDGTDKPIETVSQLEKAAADLKKKFIALENKYKKDYRVKHSPIM